MLKTYLRTLRPTIRMLAWLLVIATLLAWLVGYLSGLIVIWFNT